MILQIYSDSNSIKRCSNNFVKKQTVTKNLIKKCRLEDNKNV